MELPKFFRTYRHKQFNYIPRYYNRQKEELKERVQRIQNEQKEGGDKDFQNSIIRGSFRHVSAYRAKANRASALRTVLIIAILLMLVFVLFSL